MTEDARTAPGEGLDAHVALTLGTLDLDARLRAPRGQTVAILGPNGAGKTTLLRALAGLLPIARGRVRLDAAVLEDPELGVWVAPEARRIGVVFQDDVLFPHLSALENVAFGLRSRGVGRREARRIAHEWLARVDLGDRACDRPARLSGGQAQRVALARALATEPDLLLLDEPLAALDVTARTATRRLLRAHLAAYGGARVLITHDPLDAIVLADQIVILEHGRVVQTGAPPEITAHPRSQYVADLAGVNLLRGIARNGRVELDTGAALAVTGAGAEGAPVLVVVHPRAVSVHRERPSGSPRNVWEAVVRAVDPEGERTRVQLAGPVALVAEITTTSAAELGLAPGAPVWCAVKASEISVSPA
jgi:molybdate transport system ATP-binding protein